MFLEIIREFPGEKAESVLMKSKLEGQWPMPNLAGENVPQTCVTLAIGKGTKRIATPIQYQTLDFSLMSYEMDEQLPALACWEMATEEICRLRYS